MKDISKKKKEKKNIEREGSRAENEKQKPYRDLGIWPASALFANAGAPYARSRVHSFVRSFLRSLSASVLS